MVFTDCDIEKIIQNDFFEAIKPILEQIQMLGISSGKQDKPNIFPKKCSKCGVIYSSPKDFMNQTLGVVGGDNDVCYSIGDQTRIFRYRNCPPPCNSTLVVSSDERRDTSKKGLARRVLFHEIYSILLDTLPGIGTGACHSISLYLVRSVSFEQLTPNESYHFLKEDVANGRFIGFKEEPEVIVERIGESI